MVKNEAILKDIKKLLDLDVSEEEIILNLKEVGISEKHAKELIAEVKEPEHEMQILTDELPSKKKKKETISKKSELSEAIRDVGKNVGKALKKSGNEKTISRLSSEDVWAKGIITTINAKIDEIEIIKNEIESIVNDEIEKSLKKERDKIKVLFQSKQQLLSDSINSSIEQKITSLEKSLNEKIKKTDSSKKLNQEMLLEINSKINELNDLKKEFKKQSSIDLGDIREFMISSKSELIEMQERLDSALELMTKLTEGLVDSSEQKFNELWREKAKEIDQKLELRVSKLMELQKSTDTGAFEKKIKALNEKSLRNLQVEMDELKLSVLEEVEKARDAEFVTKKLDEKLEELESFQKQFLKIIERNTSSLHKTRDEIHSTLLKSEKKFESKAKLVDDKIKELEDFEKTFAQEMGLMLDKLDEKQKKPKKKKK